LTGFTCDACPSGFNDVNGDGTVCTEPPNGGVPEYNPAGKYLRGKDEVARPRCLADTESLFRV
jgi:hypothetical protein